MSIRIHVQRIGAEAEQVKSDLLGKIASGILGVINQAEQGRPFWQGNLLYLEKTRPGTPDNGKRKSVINVGEFALGNRGRLTLHLYGEEFLELIQTVTEQFFNQQGGIEDLTIVVDDPRDWS